MKLKRKKKHQNLFWMQYFFFFISFWVWKQKKNETFSLYFSIETCLYLFFPIFCLLCVFYSKCAGQKMALAASTVHGWQVATFASHVDVSSCYIIIICPLTSLHTFWWFVFAPLNVILFTYTHKHSNFIKMKTQILFVWLQSGRYTYRWAWNTCLVILS